MGWTEWRRQQNLDRSSRLDSANIKFVEVATELRAVSLPGNGCTVQHILV